MSKTRRQIAERVSIECSIDMRDSKEILDAILQQMSDALARGEDVKLSGFGSFRTHVSPERMGRNPRTGEPALICECQRITFKPSSALLDRMAQGDK
ncbi:MAG: HU family DNA-binding protein [Pelagimonas sp.]|uniref:HU family DNA-binding protein n=1 Tax=Pelagimonas sp. TaxID=2073170 RepID=UPI003D6BE156